MPDGASAHVDRLDAQGRSASRHRRRTVARILLDPLSIRLFGAVFVLSFLIPRHGSAIPLCWFRGLSGLPCPGCGLSRSFANISQLSLSDAVAYHPFGLVFYPLVVLLALANLLPRRYLTAIRDQLEARDAQLRPVYLLVIGSFLAFGVVRLVCEALAHGLSPAWG